MTELPKIVHDRLRAALPDPAEPAHPDADLLTAFAEQTLLAPERDGVLEHLALCGDCRELIALALPAAEIAAAPGSARTEAAAETEAERTTPISATAGRSWLTLANLAWPKLAWPALRWAAVAAGVVLAASVLLMHPGKLNQTTLPSANRQVALTAPASGARTAPSSAPSSRIAASPTAQSAISAKNDETRPKPAMQSSKKPKAGQIVTPESSAEGTLMARNEAPAIEKAKPALQSAETDEQRKTETSAGRGLAGSPVTNMMLAAKPALAARQTLAKRNVTWTIAAGVLQRSLDNGQNWQDAVRANHPLLCYASHDQDLWTGGQAGTLFHSPDNGLTWMQVQPSINAQPLTSDITHIDLRDDLRPPAEIVLSTSTNEVWISVDGGTTWEKK